MKCLNKLIIIADIFEKKIAKYAGKAANIDLDIDSALTILGLSVSDLPDDLDEILKKLKFAYRKKTLEKHPDLDRGNPDAEDNMALINKAYQYLLDRKNSLLSSSSPTNLEQDEFEPVRNFGAKYKVWEYIYMPFRGRTYESSNERSIRDHFFTSIEKAISFINQSLKDHNKGFSIAAYDNGSTNYFGHVRYDHVEGRWYYIPVNFVTPDYDSDNPFRDWDDVAKEIYNGETGDSPVTANSPGYAHYGGKKEPLKLD